MWKLTSDRLDSKYILMIFTQKVEETQEKKSGRKVSSSSRKEETSPAPAKRSSRSSRLKPGEDDIAQAQG